MDTSLYAAFKTAILAEADSTFAALRQANETGQMAAWYNQTYSPAFQVWRSQVPSSEVFGAINWKNMTPADTPDGTTTFTNRALTCQNFQFNLQILLQGQSYITTGKPNIRQGLQDALMAVPSGASGTTQDAGWLGTGKVKNTIQRPVTRAEKIWATGTGTSATPGDLGAFEGTVSNDDIVHALQS
jgi:hypothetical protein